MTKPDLNDPAQRAAYRRELQGVAKPLRYTGVAFALLGAVLAIVRSKWAPQMPSAIPVAQEEADYAIGLCAHEVGTLLAIERTFNEEGVAEKIRVVAPRGDGLHAKIWEIVED